MVACEELKMTKCLNEPNSCKWNAELKSCKPYKMTRFENCVAKSENFLALLKCCYDRLRKLNIIDGVTILLEDSGDSIQNAIPISKPLVWNNPTCTPKSIYISGGSQNSQEAKAAISKIVNRRLDELNSQDVSQVIKTMKKKAVKITPSVQYFIMDYIRYKVSADYRKLFALATHEKTSKSVLVYNGCTNLITKDQSIVDIFNPLFADALVLKVKGVCCSQLFTRGMIKDFVRFKPLSVNNITHGTFLHNPEVRDAYVNNSGSKELNISMSLMLQENEKLHADIQQRILRILTEFKTLADFSPDALFNESYVTYHGTTQEIHTTQTFVTTSFLSTTRSLKTAISYGTFVYAITVPKKFPAINFMDVLKQILLPIGTYIEVEKIVQLGTVKLVTCRITEEPLKLESFISIFQNPCVNDNLITLKKMDHKLVKPMLDLKLASIDMPRSSSTFYGTNIDGKPYIVKDIVKRRHNIRVLKSDNQVFQRVFNEVLAAHIYSRVYELETIDIRIMDKRSGFFEQPILNEASNFLLVSEYRIFRQTPVHQDERNDIYKGMLVDCIMGNWDAFNPGNVAILSGTKKIIRPDVGGALFFRGRGDANINFKKGTVPIDHMNFAKQDSFKALLVPIEKSNLAIQYLASISSAKVKSRIMQVKKEFTDLLDLIKQREYAKKYQDMLDHVIDAVLYRDAWYRRNGAKAIKSIEFVFVKELSGGVRASGAGTVTQDPALQPNKSPMSFTASPGEFKRMLERHQVCKQNRQDIRINE